MHAEDGAIQEQDFLSKLSKRNKHGSNFMEIVLSQEIRHLMHNISH